MRKFDIVVIGGGVVGLWTAMLAAKRGWKTALLERQDRLGSGTSSRNTGVLHAGLYYEPGSLKARHCVAGRRLAIDFLRDQDVPFALCGKYIVPAATSGDESAPRDDVRERLERLAVTARQNGVDDAAIVRVAGDLRPYLTSDWALHVPGTGIVDLAGYLAALEREARRLGVAIFTGMTCVAGAAGSVEAQREDGRRERFDAQFLVNAAGLWSDVVAGHFGCSGYEVRPNKGCYFQLRSPLPIRTLVYPLPSKTSTFLGIHYTPDMHGRAYAGPNSVWASSKTDSTPDADRDAFHDGLSRIVAGYSPEDLVPTGKVGLRARLFHKGAPCSDFVISEQPAGVFHLLGIESPGLTAAPSLARDVLDRIA